MASANPYLGIGNKNPYTTGELIQRIMWKVVQSTFFRFSPAPLHRFRVALLRLFGADIPDATGVKVFPTARIVFPRRLRLAPHAMIGPGVNVYNLADITLNRGSKISQDCHLCAGTHDYTKWSLPLVAKPIVIGDDAWIAADVFVGPGVTIGSLCVVGARSVVVRDLPPRTVCAGNPCKVIKERPEPS